MHQSIAHRVGLFFFYTQILFASFVFASHEDIHLIKKQQIRALHTIIEELRHHYPMLEYKKKVFDVTLDSIESKYTTMIQNALLPEEAAGIVESPIRTHLSRIEFQQILIALAAEFHDGHTNIVRQSKNRWTLGLQVGVIGGALYVTGFDQTLFNSNSTSLPLEVGDRIIGFNGEPIEKLAAINLLYVQSGTADDAFAIALESTVNVDERFYMPKVAGDSVQLAFQKPDGTGFEGEFFWVNKKRIKKTQDEFKLLRPDVEIPKKAEDSYYYGKAGTESWFLFGLKRVMSLGTLIDIGTLLNQELITKYKDLKINPVTRLNAFIAQSNGKNIGVIRIPSYSDEDEKNELKWLKEVVKRFENSTDALIIDHLDNEGGSNLYASQFLRLFAAPNAPMQGLAANIRLSDSYFDEREWERDAFVEKYPEDQALDLREDKLKDQFDKGKNTIYNAGVHNGRLAFRMDKNYGVITAFQDAHYTKPMLVLNSRDSASNGDMVPKVLQYNKRAYVMGDDSSGLGGFVFRSLEGITYAEVKSRIAFAQTFLPTGEDIENIGTLADIYRPVRRADLDNHFKSYAQEVLGIMNGVLENLSLFELQVKMKEVYSGSRIFNQASAEMHKITIPSEINWETAVQYFESVHAVVARALQEGGRFEDLRRLNFLHPSYFFPEGFKDFILNAKRTSFAVLARIHELQNFSHTYNVEDCQRYLRAVEATYRKLDPVASRVLYESNMKKEATPIRQVPSVE